MSVYHDNELWFSYVKSTLELKIEKNTQDIQPINFKKGSVFNEALHEIFRVLFYVGFSSGFLMEILKDLEKKYHFDSNILFEFRVHK